MEYGCVGEHLLHSFSRQIHRRIGRYDYELKELKPDEVGAFLTARSFKGINVTIPYKQTVIPFLDEISDRAAAIGAVNTIVNRDGKLVGDNTDFGGMSALLARMELSLDGKKVLILGTGGTSRTAVAVAHALGAATVVRVSRSKKVDAVSYDEATALHTDAAVIINTTPCGMYPHLYEAPIDLSVFPALEGVLDAVYNPLRSRLVLSARERGIKAEGGLYMLVAQGILAAERFLDEPLPQKLTDRIFDEIMAEKQNIVLIGMPGCGKSTVGRLLSERLQMPLTDTDDVIRQQTGEEITALFAAYGEAGFRERETDAVRLVCREGGQIIATGGGAILREENTEAMRMNGILLFLDRPLAQLLPTADRPLADSGEKIKALFKQRYPLYRAAADITVPVTGTAEQMAQTIEAMLKGRCGT